jgi:SAM-dependent methyltransferase
VNGEPLSSASVSSASVSSVPVNVPVSPAAPSPVVPSPVVPSPASPGHGPVSHATPLRIARFAGDWVSFQLHREALERFVPRGSRVLEISAGVGHYTEALHQLGCKISVLDESLDELESNRARARARGFAASIEGWAQCDICSLAAFPDAAFDVVVAFGAALSHAHDRRDRALAECMRVLRPRGILVLDVFSLWGSMRRNFPQLLARDLVLNRAIIRSGNAPESLLGIERRAPERASQAPPSHTRPSQHQLLPELPPRLQPSSEPSSGLSSAEAQRSQEWRSHTRASATPIAPEQSAASADMLASLQPSSPQPAQQSSSPSPHTARQPLPPAPESSAHLQASPGQPGAQPLSPHPVSPPASREPSAVHSSPESLAAAHSAPGHSSSVHSAPAQSSPGHAPPGRSVPEPSPSAQSAVAPSAQSAVAQSEAERSAPSHAAPELSPQRHCHLFRAAELEAFLRRAGLEVLSLSASSALSTGVEMPMSADAGTWSALLEYERAACIERGYLDSGHHLIAIARR